MTDAALQYPARVSREELYKQVWDTPMSRLAQRYGVSGNGLAKVCDRLRVPYPPRGYWAKKAAGKKVIQYRLPEREADTPDSTVIRPTPPAPELPPALVLVTDKIGPIVVPERLTKPHPIIARWLCEHEERRRQARLERDSVRRSLITAAAWSVTDRHLILDTLFKAAERAGIQVKQEPRIDPYFEVAGERVAFRLRETLKQVRKVKTPEAMKRLAPGEAPQDQEPESISVLSFSIEVSITLPRRTWNDGKKRPLAGQLAEILTMVLAAGPLLAEQRRQRDEAETQRRENEIRRYEESQRKRLEDNRWRELGDQAARWRKAEEIRSFLAALEQHPKAAGMLPDGTPIAAWLAWARERLARWDPMARGPEGVFEALAAITAWTYHD